MAASNNSTSTPISTDGTHQTNSSALPIVKTAAELKQELEQHQKYLTANSSSGPTTGHGPILAPAFTGRVLTDFPIAFSGSCQYGLLGAESGSDKEDPRILLNMSPPWSAFICGSQGSGKSYTTSCMLENALCKSEVTNMNNPLTAMVFHYDRFTSYDSKQICEAAYLCSHSIPVKILVSPSNYNNMVKAYNNMPGLPQGCPRPQVVKLLLSEGQLDMPKMRAFMGCGKDHELQLYMQVIIGILRDMAQEDPERRGIDFQGFEKRVQAQLDNGNLSSGQIGPLNLRMDLLRRFMRADEASQNDQHDATHRSKHSNQRPQRFGSHQVTGPARSNQKKDQLSTGKLQSLSPQDEKNLRETWEFKPGSLTIVDLSCPFVDESAACSLFTVCLQLFLEGRRDVGRVMALDEAHKFLTETSGAAAFTDELVQVIRQERHLAARVLIATQEPTLSPQLLELCRVCIVHRFLSPNWFHVLQAHVGGCNPDLLLMNDNKKNEPNRSDKAAKLLDDIVNLQTGEGLFFCPEALVIKETETDKEPSSYRRLGTDYLKMFTRQRITADGGRSIVAT